MKDYKLTIELVPKTCFYSNLRSELKRSEWDRLRKLAYKANNYRCEICGGKGRQHPVECHEMWHYDDKHKFQILIGLESLCPSCHTVKHMGKAQIDGVMDIAIEHFCRVNKIGYKEAMDYIEEAFRVWRSRSAHEWRQDLSFLERFNITPPNKIPPEKCVSGLLKVAQENADRLGIFEEAGAGKVKRKKDPAAAKFEEEKRRKADEFDEWD